MILAPGSIGVNAISKDGMRTSKNDKTCVVQLGRYGDIINILPLLRHIHARHGTPVLMVSRQFSDLLEGVSYVEPWVVELDYSEILQAVRRAEDRYERVMVSQIWGTGYNHPDKGQSYNRDSWQRAGFGHLFDNDLMLPVFDVRVMARETVVIGTLIGPETGVDYIVVQVTRSASSPYPGGDKLLATIELEAAERGIRVVDIADYNAPRLFDFLGLLSAARLIVTIDTAILHLATACSGTPCLTITNNKRWYGSEPRGKSWVPADYSDSVEDIRKTLGLMLDRAAPLTRASAPG